MLQWIEFQLVCSIFLKENVFLFYSFIMYVLYVCWGEGDRERASNQAPGCQKTTFRSLFSTFSVSSGPQIMQVVRPTWQMPLSTEPSCQIQDPVLWLKKRLQVHSLLEAAHSCDLRDFFISTLCSPPGPSTCSSISLNILHSPKHVLSVACGSSSGPLQSGLYVTVSGMHSRDNCWLWLSRGVSYKTRI